MISRILPSASSQPAAPASKNEQARIEDAAKEFESLLLASMLKSMRETGSEGWLGGGEDQTSTAAMEFAEEQFARTLAAQGGLGLASLIVSGLRRTL